MFCGSQVNPSSSSDWELVVAEAGIEATMVSLGTGFTAKFLAIEVEASNGKPHWSSGGYVYQEFDYPGLSIANPTHFLRLYTPNLIELTTNENYQYELIYYPRKYFESVTIKVWRYVGEIIKPKITIENLSIEDRLRRIEEKIDQML